MTRLLLIFAIVLVACSDQTDGRISKINETLHNSLKYKPRNWINLKRISVLEYVELLKVKESGKYTTYHLTTGNRAQTNWISESDLIYLMTLIESEEPAKCVVESISSDGKYGSGNPSTLGGQVMNIIDSYRQNVQYPGFFNTCSATDTMRVQEIKKWWEERSKQ